MSSPRARVAAMLLAALGVALLAGLGVWQLERLQWKTALISRVEARLAAPPAPAPGPAEWAGIHRADDEYRRVGVTGRYLYAHETLVKAVTGLGPGFWVMTPIETPAGWRVWVNRGFVPETRRAPADRARPEGLEHVTGLLRMSEPGGAFLRRNDPAGGRWFSRDVAAMSAAQGLDRTAPWFLDADGQVTATQSLPVPGLTVVHFRNAHLGYALTWFALALLLAGTTAVALRRRPG